MKATFGINKALKLNVRINFIVYSDTVELIFHLIQPFSKFLVIDDILDESLN